MSAFIVSKAHIDALVDVALRGPIDSETRGGWQFQATPFIGGRPSMAPRGGNEIGQELVRENVRSVHARYPNDSEEELPRAGECYWNAPYVFPYQDKRPQRPMTSVEALKAIACLKYQCCETEDWPESWAYEFLAALREAIVGSLPGYDAAPWHWTEHE